MGVSLQEGYELGDYRILRLLGAGAMGEVYEAEQKHLGRRYAVKVLPSEHSADSTFRERFRNEARLLASLEHPNVVAIHNAGEADGRFFLVMELLEPFVEVKGGGADLATIQGMLGQILSALGYAHRQGVVHRDLKPANLLWTQDGRLKVGDFGVAKVLGEAFVQSVVQETIRKTRMSDAETVVEGSSTGAADYVGTLQYMAPEVLDGESASAASDLYAVGVMAYEWLTGRKPIGRYKDASRLVPGLDPAWDRWLDGMMAAEVEERTATADAVLQALSALPVAKSKGLQQDPPVGAGSAARTPKSVSKPKRSVAPKPNKEERKQIAKRSSYLIRRAPLYYVGLVLILLGMGLFFYTGFIVFLVPFILGSVLNTVTFYRCQSKATREWRETLPAAPEPAAAMAESAAPPVEKKPMGAGRVLLVVIVLAVLGGGGFLVWSNLEPEGNRNSDEDEGWLEPDVAAVDEESPFVEEVEDPRVIAENLYIEGFKQRYWYGDLAKAVEYFRESAGWGIDAHPLAQAELALNLAYLQSANDDPDYDEAFDLADGIYDLVHERAIQGSAAAQVVLSQLYSMALVGLEVDDYGDRAVAWARAAAEQGDYLGEFLMGNYYYFDLYLDRDEEEAFQWYLKAANKGHSFSLANVGAFYQYGIGVEVDLDLARSYYQLAADRGYSDAVQLLAQMDE